MSLDNTVNVFILYGCTLSKERSSMRIVAATTDEEMLHMPLMFRTVDGTLVSDNEFADMGLYESEENVENGTEHILPFTDYGSDVESACDLEDEEDLEI